MDGLLLFSKYAFPPNRLGYCGPENYKDFFEASRGENPKKELKNLALQFEGAVPYLELIAQANAIKDIFDKRVVEAYWLGNNLLKNVKIKFLYHHIEEKFKNRVKLKDWKWVKEQPAQGAKPFHGFHVFDIYRSAGLLKSGSIDKILETIDKCRISWGKIIGITSQNAVVECQPLEFDSNNKLKLGKKKAEKFYIADITLKNGDDVSLHWDYVCDKLNPRQKRNLIYWTNYHLNLTNKII